MPLRQGDTEMPSSSRGPKFGLDTACAGTRDGADPAMASNLRGERSSTFRLPPSVALLGPIPQVRSIWPARSSLPSVGHSTRPCALLRE